MKKKMKCEQYTIRMTLTDREISVLMNTIADAKAVASLQGKPILEDIEELLQHQIVKQEREFNEKYRLERKKMREKA